MASVSKTAVSRVIAMEKDDEPKQRSREEYKKERELEEVSHNDSVPFSGQFWTTITKGQITTGLPVRSAITFC